MPRIPIPGAPIKPGFRRKFDVTFDEAVDKLEGVDAYLQAETVEGDSTITVLSSTATGAKIAVNGDGSVGEKVGSLRVDGHVGEGDVPIVQEISWTVGAPDATGITLTQTGEPDERIPDVEPPPARR